MEQCCRLCMDANPMLTSIANYRFLSVEKACAVALADLIEQYLEISMNHSAIEPLICGECLKRLEEWHSFRESCHQHDRYFQQPNIKFEEVITIEPRYVLEPIDSLERQTQDDKAQQEDCMVEEEEELELDEDGIQIASESETSDIVPKEPSKRNVPKKSADTRPTIRKQVHKPLATKGKRGRPKSYRERVESPKADQKEESVEQPKHDPPQHAARKQRPMPKICTICGVARTDMAAHMRWHNNERPYQCPHCPKIFLNSSNLKNHINLHTREKLYKCDLCDKEFASTTGRSKHREIHATERVHLCTVCGKRFKYRASLARHKLIHFEEPKQKCSVCDMMFLTKTRLTKHFMVHMNVKPFSCEVCGKAFNRKDNLKTHMKTHAAQRKREKKQEPAGLVVPQQQQTNKRNAKRMALHGSPLISLKIEPIEGSMHLHGDDVDEPEEESWETKPSPLVDDYPEGPATDDGYIYEVLETESESENAADCSTKPKPQRKRRSFCTICGKYLNNLAEHRRMHLNIRTQQCPYCEKTFVHRTNLITHLNIHTHDRTYKCEYCGSEFTSVQGLKQHRATHFEGQYACTICHRKYSRKCYLRIHHERVHRPKEKHCCLICDRQFLNPTLKEKHMKIHEDGTLHECSLCHRAYNAKRNLLRHIRTAHPERGQSDSSSTPLS
uniref:Protein krueppel n=1 Tax=Anopheles quadriannulatus TaxID=34691 RepID=A0A182X061_ANOQN